MKQQNLQSWIIPKQTGTTIRDRQVNSNNLRSNNNKTPQKKQKNINQQNNAAQQTIQFGVPQRKVTSTSKQNKTTNKTFRITSQNINNLGISPKSIKSRESTTTIGRDQSDAWLVQETGIAWHETNAYESWNERMSAVHNGKQFGHFVNNTNEQNNSKFQHGGVGVIIKHKNVSKKTAQGVDPRKLGRWSWVELEGRQNKSLVLISAYRPVESTTSGINTVFEQHVRQLATSQNFDNPREVMLVELSQFIKSLHEQNKHVILGMDANQSVRSRRMTEFAHSSGLIEGVTDFNKDKPSTSTCIKNSRHETIDGIWITPDLEIIDAGYHSEDEMIGSDHLAVWIELSHQQVLGREDTTARPNIKSLLNADNPRLVSRYIRATRKAQIEQSTLKQLRVLEAVPSNEWTNVEDTQFNNLMMQDVITRKAIAATIRKQYTGQKAWSPVLQEIRDTRRLWTLAIRMRSGFTVKSNQIRRLAKKLKVPDIFKITKEEAKERKKQADDLYQKDDEVWLLERKKFLRKLDDANAQKKGIKRASERKSRISIERQRQMGKKIARIKNKAKVTVSTLFATNPDGSKMELNTIREMEQQCIKTNIKKFTQANSTEATRPTLLSRIGEVAEKNGAQEILQGTFDTTGLSKYMIELIEGLQQHEKQITNKESFCITSEEHQKAWRKQKARTGSDSRGLSYAHFKSAASDATISEVDSKFRNIPFSKGTTPLLWQQITDFQILKKAGIFDVELMRTIQLLMADFNMNNKALGRLVMAAGESIGYFPEEITGSRKNRHAAITILNKVLINDLWRLKRITAALCSTDAKSCYDRVIHWIAILAMRRIDIPYEPLKSLFKTIQRAVHSIAIENNLSRDTYDGKKISPVLHGLGQGNGAAPAIWVMVSTVLIQMLHRRGHGAEFFSALSHNVAKTCGFMFVDDLDVIEAAHSPWATELDTMHRMQRLMYRWAGGLRASGGKLEPAKSHWYLISFEWRRHQWKYKHSTLPQGLMVEDETGNNIELTRLHASNATETLGIYTTMDGTQSAQINKLKKITTTIAAKYRKAQVTPQEIWAIFQTTLMKTWDYPKVVLNLTRADWDDIIGLICPVLLNKAGIAKTFPRLLLFAPLKYQGLGLIHPWIDQYIKQIECLIQEVIRKTFTGSLIIQVIEQTLLEIGLPGTIDQQDWDAIKGYVTNSWLKQLFVFAHHHNIQLRVRTKQLNPKRKHDEFIMKFALQKQLSPSELRRVNNVRQALQVSTLSDICNLQGTRITEDMWAAKTSLLRVRSQIWPRTGKIFPSDIKLWQQVLSLITGSSLKRKLRHPLGPWRQIPDHDWKISTSSGRLYHRIGHWWFDHAPILNRSSRGELWFQTRRHEGRIQNSTSLPHDACNADVVLLRRNIKANMVPPIQLPNSDHLAWWQDPVLQPQVTEGDNVTAVMNALYQGTLVAVSDGSHKDHHATAAFVLEKQGSETPLITGSIVVPGSSADLSPFRAEMFGILSTISWIERQGHRHGILSGTIRCGCDNQAGFKRLSTLFPISPRQSDLDLIISIKEAIRLSRYKWELFWVKGHQDSVKTQLTQEERMNVLSDSLAKACWANTAHSDRADATWASELEPTHILHNGHKVTTFDPQQVHDDCVKHQVLQYWQERHNLSETQTGQIDWNVLGAAMKKLSPEISRWTTKHLTGFTATSRVMARRGEWPQDLCPMCLEMPESAEHVWHCQSQRSINNVQQELDKLNQQLEKIKTSPAIIHVINTIFPPHLGSTTRRQLILTSDEQQLLQHQTTLGIMNFFWGRISLQWIDHQKRWLLSKATRWKPSETKWAIRFISALLEVSWNLWRQRCDYLHSPEHPWQQTTLQQIVATINEMKTQTSKFNKADLPRIQQLGHPSQVQNIDDARKVLASLQAAQLKHRSIQNSLQPQRQLFRQWLTPTHHQSQ